MPHLAADEIRAWIGANPGVALSALPLGQLQAGSINLLLEQDARGIYYSSAVTLCDALNGISSGSYSWATVQLYYSCFYSVRCILALNSVAIFHPSTQRGEYSLKIISGEAARREQNGTHVIVWEVLKRELASNTLLGEIVGIPAHEWMKGLREEANYRTPRFIDPVVPRHFSEISTLSLRAASDAYATDTQLLYAFDPDHASLAFPIECLRRAKAALSRFGPPLDDLDVEYINDRLRRAGVSEDLISGL